MMHSVTTSQHQKALGSQMGTLEVTALFESTWLLHEQVTAAMLRGGDCGADACTDKHTYRRV
jgi:hypothetical protein